MIKCGIESVKTAADVYAPVNGSVTAVNKAISEDPALVNTAAEGEGWLFRIKVSDAKELGKVLSLSANRWNVGRSNLQEVCRGAPLRSKSNTYYLLI